MTAPIKQSSFVGGEIAPFLYGRTDQAKYETGLRTMRNFIAMRHGGATNRPGTQYVDTTLNGGNQVRLIPFIFNETGIGQSYVLEFGNKYIAFYQNGGVVVSGGNPFTIATPYLQADLQSLRFVESADVVTIVHPNYPPAELKRLGPINWTLTPIVFGAPIMSIVFPITEINPNPEGTTQSGNAFSYYITAVFPDGQESLPTKKLVLNIASPSPTTPVSFYFIQLVPFTASYYNIYRSPSRGDPGGFIARVSTIPTLVNIFVDTGIVPDFTNTPPIDPGVFSSPGNYPSTVAFVQQRRGFAATNNNPLGFWLSQPGFYSNFNIHILPVDSDAIIGSVSGSEVNAIQYLIELKFFLMLTAGAEIYVQGNGNGVVTPSAINASTQSQYGASILRPLKVASSVIFNQALGSFIRDLAFDFYINGYRGNDLTVFASHLFEGAQLVDWDYQKIPDSIVWAVRNDGVLLGLTYVQEQQILAWHRHDFINGFVENVCCIPENGVYSTYLSIRRVINGQTVRYIERMSSRIWSDVLNATYLDCFSSYNGTNLTSTMMELTAPSGTFDQSGSAYQQHLNLLSNGLFFTPQMVGDEIFLSDQAFVTNKGNTVDPNVPNHGFSLPQAGNQIRCSIISYNNPNSVVVTPNRAVPLSMQAVPIQTWARAVMKVTGLDYLIGQQVSVWADRFLVASPLNRNVTFKVTVANDGSITLDKHYAVIYVGLPMISDLETLDIETSFGETLIARRKRSVQLKMILFNSRTLFAGSENPDANRDNVESDPLFQMFELKTGIGRQVYDEPPQLQNDQDSILMDTRWNKNGRIFIRNVDPTPLTLLAIVPAGDSPSPNPFYEKA